MFYEHVRNDGESVLRYRGNDKLNHYIASSLNPDGGKSVSLVENVMDNGTSVLSYLSEDGKVHYFNGVTDPCGIVSSARLKELRDSGRLVPGTFYRITDYECTTSQADTRSAGHRFDIVVLALSESKLSEDAWAMAHDNLYKVTWADGVIKNAYLYKENEAIYYVQKDDMMGVDLVDMLAEYGLEFGEAVFVDDVKKTVTITVEYSSVGPGSNVPLEPGLPYRYFKDTNFAAWKLKYCLDNDKSRFAWADDSITVDEPASIVQESDGLTYERFENGDATDSSSGTPYYCWRHGGNLIFTNTPTPKAMNAETYIESPFPGEEGEFITHDIVKSYSPGKSHANGKGVIYRMIDEHNNDCPYDFKNIQFKRWAITALTSGSDEMKAALIYDADENPVYFGAKAYDSPVISGATLDDDNYIFAYTFDGALKDAEGNITHYDVSAAPFVGPQEFIDYMIEQEMGEDIADVCYDNFIGNYGEMDIEGANLAPGLTLPNNVFFNSSCCYFDEDENYWSYAFANCYGNSLKSYCSNNTFGNNCGNNTFGNSCGNNTFGNGCGGNTFGNSFFANTFGNNCQSNTFGNWFSQNTFGNGCQFNTFGNDCGNNTFGNSCQSNTFGNYCHNNTFGNDFFNNTFGNSCSNNTFGNNCGSNTFGNSCLRNTFGNNAEKCSVGDGVQNITVSKDFMRYVIIENGNQKITITSNKTTSSSAYLQNFLIALGVNNSNNTKTISHNSVGDAFRTVYQNENSASVDV